MATSGGSAKNSPFGTERGGATVVGGRLDESIEQRRAIGKVRVVVAGTLPGEGPTATLLADIVRAVARDEDVDVAPQRQHPVVLEQNQRLANGPPGQFPMGRGAYVRSIDRTGTLGRPRAREKPCPHLHTQDAPHRIVDPGHGHGACRDLLKQIVVGGAPLHTHHQHVDAGIHRTPGCLGAVVGNLQEPVPVADHEAIETQRALQHIAQQVAVAVNLGAVPTVESGHDGLHAGRNRRPVSTGMQVAKRLLGAGDIALVPAIRRVAFPKEVFRRGQNPTRSPGIRRRPARPVGR